MDPKESAMKDGSGDQAGEGNYDASRRYRKGLEDSVEKGQSDELAEAARKALEGPEADELRQAEEDGKRGEPTQHDAHKNVPK